MSVTDNRKDWDKLLKQVSDLKKKPYASIGVLGESSGGGDFGLVEYATANEFGTVDNGGHVPERSFIRSTMDEQQADLTSFMEKKKMEILLGKETVARALGLFGAKIQAAIVKKITDFSDPPNAESTAARKGSDSPLIDSGRMRSSIKFKVNMKGD